MEFSRHVCVQGDFIVRARPAIAAHVAVNRMASGSGGAIAPLRPQRQGNCTNSFRY
jgi:hypothetical protein